MLTLYAATTPTLAEGVPSGKAAEVFGPNMAVRSAVLDAGLRFDPKLMLGADGLLGDETDFVIPGYVELDTSSLPSSRADVVLFRVRFEKRGAPMRRWNSALSLSADRGTNRALARRSGQRQPEADHGLSAGSSLRSWCRASGKAHGQRAFIA